MAKKQIELSPEEFDRKYGGAAKSSGAPKELSADEFDQLYGAKEPSSSAPQAMAQGAGNAYLGGYGPQLAAGVNQALSAADELQQKVTGKYIEDAKNTDKKLVAAGFKIKQPEDNYLSTRDQFLKQQEQVKQEHPYAFGAGEVAGSLAGGVHAGGLLNKVPALAIGKSTPFLGKVAKSAAQGALLAGAVNPGDVEGQMGGLQLDQRLKSARMGALVGGALPVVEGAVSRVGGLLKKGISQSTNIPEQSLETYYAKNPQVRELIAKTEGNPLDIADEVRKPLSEAIGQFREGKNNIIKQELEKLPASSKALKVSPQSLLNELSAVKSRLDPDLKSHAGQIAKIDELMKYVKGKAGKKGLNLNDLYTIKANLQGEAKAAFNASKFGFSQGDEVAQAAKRASGAANELFKGSSSKLGLPEINNAVSKLHEMHVLEDAIPTNLITPDGSPSALFAAGSGGNAPNQRLLEKLGGLLGSDVLGQAKLASAARDFANPGWLPTDTTGKSLTRMAAMTGLGGLVGGSRGEAGGGAAVGAAVSSPALVKKGIDVASAVSGAIPQSVKAAPGQIASPASAGMGVGMAMSQGFQRDPLVLMSESPDNVKYAVESKQIPEEAIKSFVSWTGPLTREQYIKAATKLGSVQGRKAFQAALMHVMAVDNPQMLLGPAGEQALGGQQ
jgi:hypothetical protein